MDKIAVIGGALDPITKGHLHVGSKILETGQFSEVWFMPCFTHLFGKKLASAQDRLEMCRLAVKDTALQVSDWEIARQHNGSTYSTLKGLSKDYPNKEFCWVIGLDNVDQVPAWSESEKLLREFRFVVVPRGGVPLPKCEWYLAHPHIYLEDVIMSDVSSTVFRILYAEYRGEAANYVPPAVYEYIKLQKHLYQDPGMVYCTAGDISVRLYNMFPEREDLPDDAQFDVDTRTCNWGLGHDWVSIGMHRKDRYEPLWDVYVPSMNNRVKLRMRLEQACKYLGFQVRPLNTVVQSS